jgi:hypothetical protein
LLILNVMHKMKTISLYLIWLATGILSGYILIITVGYVMAFDISFVPIKWTVHFLIDHGLSYFGELAIYTIDSFLLIVTAIPILFLFGFTLNYFFRSKPALAHWINSVGILSVFLYSAIRYGTLLVFLFDAAVIIVLNILILKRTSKMIEARANA